ncbi:MAG: sigma-54-dependent Fis family transcriptional regulator [Ignavibacteria bacterium]|nr:sigma-54-dependent Fis family transcriptional regulator [Ignavibacteria bacterium]
MSQSMHAFLAESPRMLRAFERADTIAPSESAVLLVGETGVGKEVMAEYIHRHSGRSQRPFVKVGLATLPPELLESEIFGHERGAYTSAVADKKGLFELAHKGTIFLDDIDDFPLNLQPKLLRVLEAGEVQRVGSTTPIAIDIRVICATKVDLKDMVERGAFRSDLYYRINVVPIRIPPLRERREDIPLLLRSFLDRYAPDRPLPLTEEAMRVLRGYSWPGNVRELRNTSQRIALFARDRIDVSDLPEEIREENPATIAFKSCLHCFSEHGTSLEHMVNCLEYNMLKQALAHAHGNRTKAAKYLKTSLSTFRDKLKKYNLESESPAD